MKSDTGAVILDAAVADDILAVLLLSFFVSSTSGGQNQNLLLEFGLQVLFFIFLYFLIKYLIPGIFRFVSKFDYFEKNSFLAVIICFSMAILADKVGMSAVIGSFFAGLGIGQLKIADKLTHEVAQFSYLFFIPIFFASIALPLQLDGMLKNLPLIVLFTVLAVLTKLIPSYLVARGFEFNRRNALTIGGGMVSRGEMALIIVQLGLSQSLISKATYSTLVIVVILTTLIAPFLLKITFKENKN
ncbi:hypothetical protein HMPREF9318_00372 [Streptococcus urinalis FB127-CNA-2]|uniref:Na+/H+ antiporter n=1 Tax=Streptococcus urinalis 2285-97 TaxID=764291 RepID=G5KFW4_9STRE|nr:Na+/H+ antiporter [Streptococcus urinalis 2285-97]EKS22174.1 hypothetical protein HMPREF9318_00372 [Streptococcus urinalis FB127-CNA-2]VEF31986.1 Na+/H+ antiporter [Streptococcus urinalis]